MLKKLVRKMYKAIKTLKDKVTKTIIGKTKYEAIKYDLDYKRPILTVDRGGYVFHIKDVDAIISGDEAALVVSEVAAVYKTSLRNVYVIGVDKTFKKLTSRTKQFVLEHEIAHITHGLDNPRNRLSVETKVDIVAAHIMGMNKRKLKKCLREIQDKCKYLSSKRTMVRRIKNIK